jgi:pSer/pThr/pTyr-binding forkhead associated (FHA) protein
MWHCKPCGKENPDSARTCRRCGTRNRADRLSEATHVVGAISALPPTHTTAAPPHRRGGVVSGAVARRGRLISVLPSGQDDTVHWLESDQVDLGRLEGDILFDDPQLAPRHARLNLTLGGAMLTPLDGRNGVYLRIRAAVELTDGDHILLGRQVLKFEVLTEHERRPAVAIEDGVILFGTPTAEAWGRLRQMTSSGLGRDVVHLSRPRVTLGREQADLVFADDEFLSRRHAQVAVQDDRALLTDLGSSNGTYLRLRAPHVLVPGDMIRLGDQLLRFELG